MVSIPGFVFYLEAVKPIYKYAGTHGGTKQGYFIFSQTSLNTFVQTRFSWIQNACHSFSIADNVFAID